jgi:3-phosphoshikimate 1-carboxyvinyltransferase
MTLVKTHDFKFEDVDFELNNTPDIAQTVVTCLGCIIAILQDFIL